MQSLEYFGVFTRQFWTSDTWMYARPPVDLKWACYIWRIFGPASFRVLNHFVSRIFCVIENHYVHTARNFSLSGLKLTNLGDFYFFPIFLRYKISSSWQKIKFCELWYRTERHFHLTIQRDTFFYNFFSKTNKTIIQKRANEASEANM
jgi:hypothetical protein